MTDRVRSPGETIAAEPSRSGDVHIPVIEEQAWIDKRTRTGRVRVSSSVTQEAITLRDSIAHEAVEVTRVPVEREVSAVPAVREEGGVTIVPVVEERLVVEKKLFVVEEIHLHRRRTVEAVEVPATLKRTQVEVERHPPGPRSDQQEDLT